MQSMDLNPYESPLGTTDAPQARRILSAQRIKLLLIIAGALVALYFLYDCLNSQLFFLGRPKTLQDLFK